MNNKNFKYSEKDLEGETTLNVVAVADKFNKWMYNSIKDFTKGNVLEIGSGIGNISIFFINDGKMITLSDIRNNYCEKLKVAFSGYNNVEDVIVIDIADKDFDNKYAEYFNRFDTVFSLNVIEHIENDGVAICNMYKLLKNEGVLITLVPAYQSLYCRFDKELQHFRRYTKKSLSKITSTNGFKNKKTFYFNAIGVLGWFVSGKILNKKTIPENQMKFYNIFVPFFKIIDKLLLNSFGLSVINVSVKK